MPKSTNKEPTELIATKGTRLQETDPVLLFTEVLELFDNHDKWIDAPLSKIKVISNTKVGSVGQAFIERLCGELDIPIEFPINKKGERASQSPWDVKIFDIKFELKTATEDISGSFQFNHIRYHREYEAVMCLGVSPDNLYFALWTKAEIATGNAGQMVSMEKSANASYKLTKKPAVLYPIKQFESKLKLFVKRYKQENK